MKGKKTRGKALQSTSKTNMTVGYRNRGREREKESRKAKRQGWKQKILPPAAAKAAQRLQGGVTHLSASLICPSLSSFLLVHTHFIHPFIPCKMHPLIFPSFLPSTLLQITWASWVFSFRLPLSAPILPPCFILLAGNKRKDRQWLKSFLQSHY